MAQNKTGFNAAKRRARAGLLAEAFSSARGMKVAGNREGALEVLLSARNDARLLRRMTQHWFRHLMATRMAHRDLRGTMEQVAGPIIARSWATFMTCRPAAGASSRNSTIWARF